jgi:hypothetical protein
MGGLKLTTSDEPVPVQYTPPPPTETQQFVPVRSSHFQKYIGSIASVSILNVYLLIMKLTPSLDFCSHMHYLKFQRIVLLRSQKN